MVYSAPNSPAPRKDSGADGRADRSPARLFPFKSNRTHPVAVARGSSLPPRRLPNTAKLNVNVRHRLTQYHTFDDAVSLITSSKNIIVLTGAGISTSLGIPDFRSSRGVYDLLVDSIYDDPQELFHIDNFKTQPDEFFKQAAKVFPKMMGLDSGLDCGGSTKPAVGPSVPRFSSTHAFLVLLQSLGKLLTNYTQNIDGLETAAGVPLSNLIHCHGSLATASCMSCGKRVSARKYMPVVRAGGIPFCKCSETADSPRKKAQNRPQTKKRKRYDFEDSGSDMEESNTPFPKGLLKPDMIFFGEHISRSYSPRLELDKDVVDLLVIIGTSLKVEPVNDMLLAIPSGVPQIWISKDRCQRQGVKVDIELLGECDLIVEEIARRAGWTRALTEKMWSSQVAENSIRSDLESAQKPLPLTDEEKLRTTALGGVAGKDRAPTLLGALHSTAEAACTSVKSAIKTNDVSIVDKFKAGSGQGPFITVCSASELPRLDLVSAAPRSDVTFPTSKVTVELEEGTLSRWFVRRST